MTFLLIHFATDVSVLAIPVILSPSLFLILGLGPQQLNRRFKFDKTACDDRIFAKMAKNIKKEIEKIVYRYHLLLIYAFGSKGKEAFGMSEGKITSLSPSTSDLDIGIKPKRPLTVEEKVEIAIFFEELFDVQRVDVVVLPEAPISLALEIVTGEILYAHDITYEAEYQLYIMKMAAELSPYEHMKKKMAMGV